jgi:hypothetical protein
MSLPVKRRPHMKMVPFAAACAAASSHAATGKGSRAPASDAPPAHAPPTPTATRILLLPGPVVVFCMLSTTRPYASSENTPAWPQEDTTDRLRRSPGSGMLLSGPHSRRATCLRTRGLLFQLQASAENSLNGCSRRAGLARSRCVCRSTASRAVKSAPCSGRGVHLPGVLHGGDACRAGKRRGARIEWEGAG